MRDQVAWVTAAAALCVMLPTGCASTTAADTVRIAAIGDYGNDNENERRVADLIESLKVDIIITTGDNSYGSRPIDDNVGKYFSRYIGNYLGEYLPGADTNRFFPTLGNHDYTDGEGVHAYLEYFTVPGKGVATSGTSGNERYYDFKVSPVHFFALNSNRQESDGISDTSKQASWLRSQLAISTARWQVVVMHHAPYSSSSNHGSETAVQWPFEDWGVDVVLAGHDHTYERILRDDNGDGDSLAYFVTGLGGKSRYQFPSGSHVPGSAVRYRRDFGVLLIEVSEAGLRFEFISASGKLVDVYRISE